MKAKQEEFCGFCGNSLGIEIYSNEYVESLQKQIIDLKGRISSDIVVMIGNIKSDMLTVGQIEKIRDLCNEHLPLVN